MKSIGKKLTLVLFLGLFITGWILGATHVFPPEIFHFDKTLHQSIQVPLPEAVQVRVIKANAVLRLKPIKESVVLKKLPLGALLDVDEEIDDWLKITLPPDEDDFVITGYLQRSFVEKASIIHE
jgi:hypothetical protein